MTLTLETANENVRNTQYAVRGEIVQIAAQLAAEGKKIIYCNIGNPQSLGQKPITFFRQVIALCDCPSLLESDDVGKLFPEDAIARAKDILAHCKGGTGAYSMSKGILVRPSARPPTPFPSLPHRKRMRTASLLPSYCSILTLPPFSFLLLCAPPFSLSLSLSSQACREAIARGIERRDGFPSDPDSIFITDGASPGVHMCMKVLLRNTTDAILTPIPQ